MIGVRFVRQQRADSEERTLNRSLGAVVGLVGLAFLLGAWLWVSHERRFRREAVATSGRVIANVMQLPPGHPIHPRHVSYCAVVAYSIAPGQPPVQYRDDLCSNPPSFTVGQSVKVYYDAAKPTRAMIDHGAGMYWIPGALGVFGLVCLLGGLQRLAGRGIAGPPDLLAVRDPGEPTVWQ
jgi:hypothetical protein